MDSIVRCVILTFILGVTCIGCGGKGHNAPEPAASTSPTDTAVITLSPAAIRESGITITTVQQQPLTGSLDIPARLLPNQDYEAQVGSLVEGRVEKVFANVGDIVKPGQELLRIEGVEVGEIKARFITARAHLTFAEASLQRHKTLAEQKVGSQRSLLEAQAEYDKALAAFDAEDKRIHSIGLRDDDLLAFVEHGTNGEEGHTGGVLPITSPIGGVVVERNVVIGQFVDAATTAFRIMNTATLWADGQIYEKDVPRLLGKPAVTLTLSAYSAETFPGTLVYVSPLVDEHTRTITVRAMIPNRSGRLKPNMFGELHVPIGVAAHGILIPDEAVQRETTAQFVFVALSDTTFERRRITPGTTFGTMVEVRTGVRAGERIVTQGSFHLKAEMMKSALEGGE